MVQVHITDPDHPELDTTLTGEFILCVALKETGDKFDVRSGIAGASSHTRLVALLSGAAEVVALALEGCHNHCVEAASKCAAILLTRAVVHGAKPKTEEQTEEPAEECSKN